MATKAFNKKYFVPDGQNVVVYIPDTHEDSWPRDVVVEAIPLAGTANVEASAAPRSDIEESIANPPVASVVWFQWQAGPVGVATQDIARPVTALRLSASGGDAWFNVRFA